MSARAKILARVREAEHRRQTKAAPHVRYRPSAAQSADLAAQFVERAARLGSEVTRVHDMAQVPATIARYLDAHRLARHAVCWPEVTSLPWREAHISVQTGAARGDDLLGISGVFAAIAETGTLMLISGANTAATVSLLPETHIAIVATDRIVHSMEDAWTRLRQQPMPRAVNFVSGPSRTADVEQTVTLGAHGPRRVLILVVGN